MFAARAGEIAQRDGKCAQRHGDIAPPGDKMEVSFCKFAQRTCHFARRNRVIARRNCDFEARSRLLPAAVRWHAAAPAHLDLASDNDTAVSAGHVIASRPPHIRDRFAH